MYESAQAHAQEGVCVCVCVRERERERERDKERDLGTKNRPMIDLPAARFETMVSEPLQILHTTFWV